MRTLLTPQRIRNSLDHQLAMNFAMTPKNTASRTAVAILAVMLASVPTALGASHSAHSEKSGRNLATELQRSLAARLPDNAPVINVEMRGAEVVLTGEVDLLAKRQIATEAAEAIPGIISVVNRLEVRPAQRSDEIIALETKSAFESEQVTATQIIDVSVEDRVVTLQGLVDTVAQKRLAAWLAANQPGVRAVKNELRVAPASRPDAELQRELQALLARDPVFADDEMTLAISQGAVVLTGTVDSLWERQRAENAAWIPGVLHVDVSQLKVIPTPANRQMATRSSGEILRDLGSAVANNAALANNDLKPEVSGGIVILGGEVDTFFEKTIAEDLVRHLPGVSEVTNRLRIKGVNFAERAEHYHAPPGWNSGVVMITPGESPQKADATLKAAIERALTDDPRLFGEKIEVSVQRGVVRLRGSVGTTPKQTAAVAIARATGARVVIPEFTAGLPR